MQISVVGSKHSYQIGLTLIELMIVLVVMALVTSLAVIALKPPRGEAEVTANALAVTLNALSFASVAEARPVALTLNDGVWQGLSFRDGRWLSIQSVSAARGAASAEVKIEMSLADEFNLRREDETGPELLLRGARAEKSVSPAPRLQFSPVGDATPAVFEVVGPGEMWIVSLAGNGDVGVQRAKP